MYRVSHTKNSRSFFALYKEKNEVSELKNKPFSLKEKFLTS